MRSASVICAAVLLAGTGSVAGVSPPPPSYDWTSIKPSTDIKWEGCYSDEFQCARLVLPLDWLSVEPELGGSSHTHGQRGDGDKNNRTVSVAVIKLPATVPDSDPSFAGPIFTNPGGPGNSGIEFIHRMGRHLQRIADSPGRRHYDIISFDPRGIGESEPRADCFHRNLLARQAMELEDRGTWGLDTGKASLTYSLAAMDAYGRRCEETDLKYGADVMRYVGTPSVARDMVEMADKIDLERRQRLAGLANNDDNGIPEDGRTSRLELKKRGDDEKEEAVRIQFVGFSYGTVLGHYFAALFPHRVGRLILDGVCDAYDYATGDGWLTNLADTDATFDKFLQGCHDAGKPLCALAKSSDASWEELRDRVFDFIDALDARPQAVLMSNGNNVVVTGHDIRKLIGVMLYKPLVFYKPFSTMLDEVMRGNNTLLAETLVDGGYIPLLREGCSASNEPNGGNKGRKNSTDGDDGDKPVPRPAVQGVEGLHSVLCGDGDDVSDRHVGFWSSYVDFQVNLSRILGAYWSTIRFGCSGWRFRPNWSFKGPFTTPAPGSGPHAPSAPILFLTNRLDPVTPLGNARVMARQHPGAGIVVQESMGHCAIASAPSRCTAKFVSDYLEYGTVPEGEVTCAQDCGAWDDDCQFDPPDITAGLSLKGSQHVSDSGEEDILSIFRRQDLRSFRFPKRPLGIF